MGPATPSWVPERRVGPSAGWYVLPVVLLFVALVGFFAVLAFLWDDSKVADGPPAAGDPVVGVRVQLSEGYGYFLYVRTGGSSPYSCVVDLGERSGPVRLTRKNSWSATDRAGYRYTATFLAPVSGTARLTCKGTDGPILVTPDDTVHGYLGFALLAALGLGGLAALSFAVTLLRRGAAKRRTIAPPPYAR
ncbi:hypothetical protein [Actinomadura sp. BRA 177]|uniref:hypothetical protein n=1 Tax=Actinomadura sp. BRA 177 TaxID=2745202 RepID=UPI0015953350|nr:hypothetical protein [Actinomadura sp. BRA 177]NVI87309.1 hypothetical protein [Actinomadura sp. BRA 177]